MNERALTSFDIRHYPDRLALIWGLQILVALQCDGLGETVEWLFNTFSIGFIAPMLAIHPRTTATGAVWMAIQAPESIENEVSQS